MRSVHGTLRTTPNMAMGSSTRGCICPVPLRDTNGSSMCMNHVHGSLTSSGNGAL